VPRLEPLSIAGAAVTAVRVEGKRVVTVGGMTSKQFFKAGETAIGVVPLQRVASRNPPQF